MIKIYTNDKNICQPIKTMKISRFAWNKEHSDIKSCRSGSPYSLL